MSLKLLDNFNSSEVRHLFEANIGRKIDAQSIQRAMEWSFGEGAGNRLRIACRKDGTLRIITEITIGLSGKLAETTDLATLVSGSEPTETGCPSGIVDPAGIQ